MEEIKIIPAVYMFNKDNCRACPLFKEGWCRFSDSFHQGCEEGRAMLCCAECKIENSKIISVSEEIGEVINFDMGSSSYFNVFEFVDSDSRKKIISKITKLSKLANEKGKLITSTLIKELALKNNFEITDAEIESALHESSNVTVESPNEDKLFFKMKTEVIDQYAIGDPFTRIDENGDLERIAKHIGMSFSSKKLSNGKTEITFIPKCGLYVNLRIPENKIRLEINRNGKFSGFPFFLRKEDETGNIQVVTMHEYPKAVKLTKLSRDSSNSSENLTLTEDVLNNLLSEGFTWFHESELDVLW